MKKSILLDKIMGCVYGGAVGDAMGAPAEWHYPDEIRERYGYITDFVENWEGPNDIGKGDGRYTDDSHMIQLLSRAYIEHGGHLDSYEFAKRIIPLITDSSRWIPELGKNIALLERLFYPEKWLFMRLHLANAEPRQGGIGNMVNCGAAMYSAPVGIVNACDPQKAYSEAIDIFSAHQHSYGLEAAGVMAACTAEAFRPNASVESVIEVAIDLAKDGTKNAIKSIVDCAENLSDWKESIIPLRDCIRPFDGSAEKGKNRGNGTNNWRPSREHSIEELPIALGFLIIASGDFEKSIFGASNYGRDNDSIAGMVGAISGALNGAKEIRKDWINTINEANRVDLVPMVRDLHDLRLKLHEENIDHIQNQKRYFQSLNNQINKSS
tara:strand:- start:1638 stop:2780 length:1143 start_codon:yes stop_codon:yes gene_type:complete